MTEPVEVSPEFLEEVIQRTFRFADREVPDWRKKLSECCLSCSDLPGAVLYRLSEADTAHWLLTGKSYREWREHR